MTDPAPTNVPELQELVRGHPRVLACGARTKPALSAPPDGVTPLDLTALRGIVEYQPSEFVVTARAGTRVRDLADELAAHGQYLPFDPPWTADGATLGGTVAAGMNGPGMLRYGGIRDFVIGLRYVDGAGAIVRGGGRVVKNAAGFDLPKLFVGSAGRLGVIVELTLKVFPAPAAARTIRIDAPDLAAALAAMTNVFRSDMEADAIEIEPPGRCYVRLTGPPEAMKTRCERLAELLGGPLRVLADDDAASLWWARDRFAWSAPDDALVKVPSEPRVLPGLDERLESHGASRRYGAMGNVAWFSWPRDRSLGDLETILTDLGRSGLILRRGAGPDPDRDPSSVFLNRPPGMTARIKSALDPGHRFPEIA